MNSINRKNEQENAMKKTRVESIEASIKQLTPQEYREFRNWFYAYNQDSWDVQLETDINSGKLDSIAQEALKEFSAGNTTEL